MNDVPLELQASEPERAVRAMMEALLMADPTLKGRLTIGACLNYLKLDDKVFGWNAAGPMTLQLKIACVMPTIAHGLPPGSIIVVGNKPYATAEAWATVVNRDCDKATGITERSLTKEEREMYALKDGDLAIFVEQTMVERGREIVWRGLGIIGADEIGRHITTKLTRDRIQTLRTRAVRDMYRRNWNISGLKEAEEAEEVLQAASLQPAMQTVNVTPAVEPIKRSPYVARFTALVSLVKNEGGDAAQILDLNPDELTQSGAVQKLLSASEVLEDWLKENRQVVLPEEPVRERSRYPGRKPGAKDKKPRVRSKKKSTQIAPYSSGSEALALEQKYVPPSPAVLEARSRLQALMELVQRTGGSPVSMLTQSPQHLLATHNLQDIQNACKRLEQWVPQNAAKRTSSNTFPQTPNATAADKGYKVLRDAYEHFKTDVKLRTRIIALAHKRLIEGDHALIRAALSMAATGKFRDIDDLISSRKDRRL